MIVSNIQSQIYGNDHELSDDSKLIWEGVEFVIVRTQTQSNLSQISRGFQSVNFYTVSKILSNSQVEI